MICPQNSGARSGVAVTTDAATDAATDADTAAATSADTDATGSYTCPTDWILMGTKCYFFVKTSKTYDEALLECRNIGGQMVRVFFFKYSI